MFRSQYYHPEQQPVAEAEANVERVHPSDVAIPQETLQSTVLDSVEENVVPTPRWQGIYRYRSSNYLWLHLFCKILKISELADNWADHGHR